MQTPGSRSLHANEPPTQLTLLVPTPLQRSAVFLHCFDAGASCASPQRSSSQQSPPYSNHPSPPPENAITLAATNRGCLLITHKSRRPSPGAYLQDNITTNGATFSRPSIASYW